MDHSSEFPRLHSEYRNRWLASNLLPYEGEVRRWLSRFRDIEPSEIIQNVWLVAAEADVTTIRHPRAWFFGVTRNVIRTYYRARRVVSLESLSDIASVEIADPHTSVESSVSSREELFFLSAVMETMPSRCRNVFILRRIYGYSQHECASRLNVSEHAVEREVANALRLIAKAIANRDISARNKTGHDVDDATFCQRTNRS